MSDPVDLSVAAAPATSSGVSGTRAKRRRATSAAFVLAHVAILVFVLAVWAAFAQLIELVPPVAGTFEALARLIGQQEFWAALASTLSAVFEGFAIALVVGLLIGYFIGRSRRAYRVVEPVTSAAFAVPRIIFYPVLLLLLGISIQAKAGMAGVSAVFPIILLTAGGVREIKKSLLDVGHVFGCSRLQVAAKIVIPASLPTLLVATRIGFSVAFIGTTIAEFFAAIHGLGVLIQNYYQRLDVTDMFAVIIVIFVIAVGVNISIWGLETRLERRRA